MQLMLPPIHNLPIGSSYHHYHYRRFHRLQILLPHSLSLKAALALPFRLRHHTLLNYPPLLLLAALSRVHCLKYLHGL
jgi:hypothetical protein